MDVRITINVSLFIISMGILLLFTVALSCETALCAETITYQNTIRDALGNSARVRVKIEDIRITDAIYRQNYASVYPEISANSRMERYENLDKRLQQNFNTIYGEVVGGDQSAWRSSFYLLGQYYVSNWYKKRYEALYYEKLKDTRIHECAVETKKLLREVTDVYGSLVEGKIKLRYSSDILRRLHGILSLKKEAFARGQVSYEEVLKAEADSVAVDKEMAGIRKDIRENIEKLFSYTGKTYREDMEIEAFKSDGQRHITVNSWVIEDTPEYKARMKEHEAQIIRAKASTNNFWPDVSLYGRYDYYGSNQSGPDSSLHDVRESSYAAGIYISIPLIDGGARKWERKRSSSEIRKMEESVKAVAEEKVRDIKTLSTGYMELSKALKHYRKLTEQYVRMLEITKKAHGFGERSITDILDIEKETLTVERDLKVTEHAMAVYEKRLALETDYHNFMMEHYGDGACKY